MVDKTPGFGIYLKIKSSRGFSRNESAISFGLMSHEVVDRKNVLPYSGDNILKVTLKAYLDGANHAIIEFPSINGVRYYSVRKDQLLFLNRRLVSEGSTHHHKNYSFVSDRRAGIESRLPQMPKGDYVEILLDKDRSRKQPEVHFGEKGEHFVKVYREDVYRTDNTNGFLKIDLESELSSDLEKSVDIIVASPNKDKSFFPVPRRYIHRF